LGEKIVERTTIILAGNGSGRLGCDRGLAQLANRPLIMHVVSRVQSIVDEVIVCLKDRSQIPSYSQILPKECRIIADEEGLPECPLRGAYTGLMNARGGYSAILPCDTPFVSAGLIDLLFNAAAGVNAAVLRWPEGFIEPLQAVYRTEAALRAARRAFEGGSYSMRAMISLLKGIRYISTLVVEKIDPKMHTFVNINAPLDLKRAETLAKRLLA